MLADFFGVSNQPIYHITTVTKQVISHVHTKNIENDLRILSGLLNTSLKFFCSYFIDLTYNNI